MITAINKTVAAITGRNRWPRPGCKYLCSAIDVRSERTPRLESSKLFIRRRYISYLTRSEPFNLNVTLFLLHVDMQPY